MTKSRPDVLDATRLKRLGFILRIARENLRYSYRELAELSGVSASQLLRMESGEFDFSTCKLLRVAETLGLSVGIILEEVMFRSPPRPEFGIGEKEGMELLIRKFGGGSDEQTYNKLLDLRHLVMSAAEAVAALLLSSNPLAASQDIWIPFEPVNDRILGFGETLFDHGQKHYERLAQLKALLDDPLQKLQSLGIIDDALLTDYLKWRERNDLLVFPKIGLAGRHVLRPERKPSDHPAKSPLRSKPTKKLKKAVAK